MSLPLNVLDGTYISSIEIQGGAVTRWCDYVCECHIMLVGGKPLP